MKLSASLFSRDGGHLQYVRTLQSIGVNNIHVDIFEENFDKNLEEVLYLAKECPDITFDVHLITRYLDEKTVDLLNISNVDYFSAQYENLENKKNLNALSCFAGYKGIAITMDTPLNIVERYVGSLDYILVMCTVPGISGVQFDSRNIARIDQLRKMYPNLPLHIDGGIDLERIEAMRMAGVFLVVCGSFLSKVDGRRLAERVLDLKRLNPFLQAGQIMRLARRIVTCRLESDMLEVLLSISINRWGIAFVVDNAGLFVGVISDGDIRRALIRDNLRFPALTAADLVNKNAYAVPPQKAVVDIMVERFLHSQSFITVVPVIYDNRLVGALDLKEYI